MKGCIAVAGMLAVAALTAAGCGAGDDDGQGSKPSSDSGMRFVLSGGPDQLVIVDSHGSPSEVSLSEIGVPAKAAYSLLRRGEELVLFDGRHAYATSSELDSDSRALGGALGLVAGSTEETVWLEAEGPTSEGPHRLTEVRIDDGTTRGELTEPEPGWSLAGATSKGLVFDSESGVIVWDQATASAIRRLPGARVDTAAGATLSWCDAEGGLHVGVGSIDMDVAVLVPAGYAEFLCGAGALSPDAAQLAIPIKRTSEIESPVSLAVVDVRTGAVGIARQSTVDFDGYALTGWDPTGTSAFLTGADGGDAVVVEYRPQVDDGATIPLGRVHFFSMAIVG